MENGKKILETNEKNAAIIADLCALRSGMSVISQKFDNICAKKEEINEILSKTVVEHNEIAKEINDASAIAESLDFDELIGFRYPTHYSESADKREQTENEEEDVVYFSADNQQTVSEIINDIDRNFNLLNLDSHKNTDERLEEIRDKNKKSILQVNNQIEGVNNKKIAAEQRRQLLKKPVKPKYITHGKPPKALMIIFYILGIYALVMIAAGSLGSGFDSINEEINGIKPGQLMLIGGIVFTVLAIIMNIVRKRYFLEQELREKYSVDVFHFNNKFNKISNEIDELTNDINSYEKMLATTFLSMESNLTDLGSKINNLRIVNATNLAAIKTKIIPEIEQLVKESEEIKNGLIKSFDAIINQADWQNIDLIIFNMTSGRAETFKESLQLVDRVSLNKTTVIKTIGDTIYKRFADFDSVIMQSFEKLSDSVHLSTTELGNALIEKSNETSGKLYNDIIYVSGIIKQ